MDFTLPDTIRQQRQQLRQQLRAARRNLSPLDQARASRALKTQLRRQLWFLRARHLSFYQAADGELALTPDHFQPHQQTYLPCLPALPGESMGFAPWRAGEPLAPNRFGIAEPLRWREHAASPWALDVLLMPLAGFDRSGNRLGMGGGFYDRLLERLQHWHSRPLLVGIAHPQQEVAAIPAAPWDQPLDWVVTPREAIDCRRIRRRG